MGKNLLIVESPAKAKTIEKYLGKDFVVRASYGHVRDLEKSDAAINVEDGFEPSYIVIPDKKKIIKELKDLTKKAEEVWLATDEDREGEAISWHLAEVLGLDPSKTKRIVYHEISKTAIQAALDNPRFIDQNLVNAQQARRVLDRLVGFKVSPILWKKIKVGLSAGRVQSVAVRLIVERERDIIKFDSISSFKIEALFGLEMGSILEASTSKNFSSEAETTEFLESCKGAEFEIKGLEKKPSKKSPSAPFITSTLQQDASRKLGFSIAQTMRVAQNLYENGHITYMRTDSVNLSEGALKMAEDVISEEYGSQYHLRRVYKSKNSGAQEAHEAIRPSSLAVKSIEGDRNEERLYDLIWKRTISCQMADAKLERTIVKIGISSNPTELVAKGEVLLFDGFLKVYLESKDEDEEENEEKSGVLPPLSQGQLLSLNSLTGRERFSRPPARFTEASLVKTLEEKGIGRPSTYAPTISTIQKRNYVVKDEREGRERAYRLLTLKDNELSAVSLTEITGKERGKLFPTDLGILVNDFLTEYFPKVLDYSFTKNVEAEFDQIADGKKVWNEMISNFYGDFSKKVTDTTENAERVNKEIVLGNDPKTGLEILAKFGKFGPYVQLGVAEGEKKPKYAKLRNNQRLDTLTLEDALELFKMPRELGVFEDETIKANIGRFGPYVQQAKLFVSIPKEEDVYSITFERALELIKEKKEADANKHIATLADDCQVLRGRYGPYIKYGKVNLKIPKDKEPEDITLEDAKELLKNYKPRSRKKK